MQQLVEQRVAVFQPAMIPEFFAVVAEEHDDVIGPQALVQAGELVVGVADVVVVAIAHVLAIFLGLEMGGDEGVAVEFLALERLRRVSREQAAVVVGLFVGEVRVHQVDEHHHVTIAVLVEPVERAVELRLGARQELHVVRAPVSVQPEVRGEVEVSGEHGRREPRLSQLPLQGRAVEVELRIDAREHRARGWERPWRDVSRLREARTARGEGVERGCRLPLVAEGAHVVDAQGVDEHEEDALGMCLSGCDDGICQEHVVKVRVVCWARQGLDPQAPLLVGEVFQVDPHLLELVVLDLALPDHVVLAVVREGDAHLRAVRGRTIDDFGANERSRKAQVGGRWDLDVPGRVGGRRQQHPRPALGPRLDGRAHKRRIVPFARPRLIERVLKRGRGRVLQEELPLLGQALPAVDPQVRLVVGPVGGL